MDTKTLEKFKQYGMKQVASVSHKGIEYPLYVFKYGNTTRPQVRLILTAVVHGLERIGLKIILSFLKKVFKKNIDLSEIEITGIPVANPSGYVHKTRSNLAGVDLMRNAPFTPDNFTIPFLGGHKISSKLPYYQGEKLEPENKFFFGFIQTCLQDDIPTFHFDMHSGIGSITGVWPPKNNQYKRNLLLYSLVKKVVNGTSLVFEEQFYYSKGDMLEYIFEQVKQKNYAPVTIEIGFWKSIIKNPKYWFNINRWFNPSKKHKKQVIKSHRDFIIKFIKEIQQNPLLIK